MRPHHDNTNVISASATRHQEPLLESPTQENHANPT